MEPREMTESREVAPRDTMAEYIRQLLDLDESGRRETLESLSQYAESKCSNTDPSTGCPAVGHQLQLWASTYSGTSRAPGGPVGWQEPPWILPPMVAGMSVEQLALQKAFGDLSKTSLVAAAEASLDGTHYTNGQHPSSLQADLRQVRSSEPPMPVVLQDPGEVHGPSRQALKPGPLMWNAFPAAAAAQPWMGMVKAVDSSAHGGLSSYNTTSEQQRIQQLPSAEVAQRKGGTPVDVTQGNQTAADSFEPCHDPSFLGVDGEESSLRSYLNYLKQIDTGRILLARKINRLGFDSAAVLSAHYGAYGRVEHVFVPRSRSVARSQSNRPFVRKRPSGIGFVVMGDSQGVDAILRDGEAQSVAGVTVYLQRFRRQSFCDDSEEVA